MSLSGNDLARVLGWGGGYVPTDDMHKILHKVAGAHESMIDRCERTHVCDWLCKPFALRAFLMHLVLR